jgi:inner membrane protein
MLGRTHQLIGFTAVYSLALINGIDELNNQTLLASLLLITLGSLAPDLDNENNKLYGLAPVGKRIFSEIGERFFGKHRSISHSLLGTVLFFYTSHWLVYKIPIENGFDLPLLWYSFAISLLAHLAADALTNEGIPLLWPLKLKFGFPPFKFLRIKTGGFVEKYFVSTITCLFLFFITVIKFEALLKLLPYI